MHRLPAMTDDPGVVVQESTAAILYLLERYGAPFITSASGLLEP